ncbi:hypothetical protein [Streptomyces sp. NPDC046197]|uniref:hypothetical protein n=1 Tax=Streptomyces sp. NPDC046197 TaxID=3154337 RepID=UPI0033E08DB4
MYNRLRKWAIGGTWARGFSALLAQADADENLDWAVSVVSTIVRGSHACSRGEQKGAAADEPAGHAIGRSRGGLTTGIHLAG